MQFAYHATMCPPEHYLPLAIAAEQAGFATFTVPDSICYPQESDSKYPYNADGSREFLDGVPFLEPFSLIPAMGAVTTTLRFSTSVMKLAIRQPAVVAKSVSSVVLGVTSPSVIETLLPSMSISGSTPVPSILKS